MISKIHYAIAWKEIRQSLLLLIGLFAIPFLIDSYFFLDQLRTQRIGIKDYIVLFSVIYAFIVSMCIAYLFGAGYRVIEASQGLESFLRVRPVSYSTIIKTYYIAGLLVWMVWICLLIFQYGYEMFLFGYSGLLSQSGKVYLLFVTSFIGIYTITFFSAYLKPTFTCTSTTFWIVLFLITIGEYSPRTLYNLFDPFLRIYPLLIPLLIGGMVYGIYAMRSRSFSWKSLFSR